MAALRVCGRGIRGTCRARTLDKLTTVTNHVQLRRQLPVKSLTRVATLDTQGPQGPRQRCFSTQYDARDINEVATADDHVKHGRWQTAVPLLNRALEIVSPMGQTDLSNSVRGRLASVLQCQGQYRKEYGVRTSIMADILKQVDRTKEVQFMNEFAPWVLSMVRTGLHSKAVAECDRALNLFEKSNPQSAVECLLLRAVAELSSGGSAQDTLTKAHAAIDSLEGPSTSGLRQDYILLHGMAALRGHSSLPDAQEQLEALSSSSGANHSPSTAVLALSTEAALSLGDTRLANQRATALLKEEEQSVGSDDHPLLVVPVALLAKVQHADGDFMAAEALYRSATSYANPTSGRPAFDTITQELCDTQERFARLLEMLEWNGKLRTEEALQMRKKNDDLFTKYPELQRLPNRSKSGYDGRLLTWWLVERWSPNVYATESLRSRKQ